MSAVAVIKTIDGIDIIVTDDGKFEATIGEKKIRRTSLAAVEKTIIERRNGLVAQMISTSQLTNRRRTQTSIIDYVQYDTVRLSNGELEHLYREDPFVCTPTQIEQVDALISEQRALDERWGEMIDSLTKVTQSNFKLLRQGEQA